MNRARRPALLLLLAAGALPGCFFVRSCVPLDASGMRIPADWAAATFDDQAARTSERVEGFPAAFTAHVNESWTRLTTYPGE